MKKILLTWLLTTTILIIAGICIVYSKVQIVDIPCEKHLNLKKYTVLKTDTVFTTPCITRVYYLEIKGK